MICFWPQCIRYSYLILTRTSYIFIHIFRQCIWNYLLQRKIQIFPIGIEEVIFWDFCRLSIILLHYKFYNLTQCIFYIYCCHFGLRNILPSRHNFWKYRDIYSPRGYYTLCRYLYHLNHRLNIYCDRLHIFFLELSIHLLYSQYIFLLYHTENMKHHRV